MYLCRGEQWKGGSDSANCNDYDDDDALNQASNELPWATVGTMSDADDNAKDADEDGGYWSSDRQRRVVERQTEMLSVTVKPRSHRERQRALTRVDTSNQTNVKDSKHSHRPRRRVSTNLHTSNKWCQFKLCIGYWTSNNNKWPKCSCRYHADSITRQHLC